MTSLQELQERAHATSTAKGFWEGVQMTDAEMGNKLMLIVGEVAEAHEALRVGEMVTYISDAGKLEGLPVELADIAIRLLDLCGALGIDLESQILQKMDYNDKRPYKHGKRF